MKKDLYGVNDAKFRATTLGIYGLVWMKILLKELGMEVVEYNSQGRKPNSFQVSRVINSGKPSGDRVSFRSPSPSPNTFQSVGSSSENTHHRQTFPANFPATFFSDTDHTRRSAWRRSLTFVKALEPKDHPRAGHVQFSIRRLHLTRWRVRAHEDFPQPRASSSSLA
ncbi:hypothetical protein CK203_080660 [Vitis vinifera]|uniref:Uncharacterized protein n=1 Tax=Vitis vinifera TaxID=29760 RepID=A0A438EZC9_VITVI|nr:hypothetical protein CK203_080660 [Vitis vinifera]